MKKTILAILALATFSQAGETPAYVVKDKDFAYHSGTGMTGKLILDDQLETFNTGTFAISFDLSSVLSSDDTGNSFDFQFGYGGNEAAGNFAFSYAPNPVPGWLQGEYILTFPNVDIMSGIGLDSAISADRLIFQVTDFFGDTPTASLFGYTEGAELETFWSVDITSNLPTSITTASLRVCGIGEIYTPLEGIDLTIWHGKVTAADMANPASAPTVPEPTTSTLSLLALAGLAARRRRH